MRVLLVKDVKALGKTGEIKEERWLWTEFSDSKRFC